MRPFLLLVLFASVLFANASADVVVLPCSQDNTLFADANGDTSNGAGPAIFSGRNGQGRTMRALVAFDLSSAPLLDARIDSVALTLVVSSAGDTAATVLSLHRILRTWGEGTSFASGGTGAPATAGDATWLYAFYPADLWSAPGGDFDPAESVAQTCVDLGKCSWRGPGLVADLESWLMHPATNHGWLLRGVETGLRTVRRFGSREATAPADRPTLTIYFTPHPVETVSRTWGRLKASYR
jgi:hypothetical protein